MNCKPGDMAIIVKSVAGNEGKFVTCIEFHEERAFVFPDGVIRHFPSWKVDRKLFCNGGASTTRFIPDEWLRPIRPGDLHETEDDLNEVSA